MLSVFLLFCLAFKLFRFPPSTPLLDNSSHPTQSYTRTLDSFKWIPLDCAHMLYSTVRTVQYSTVDVGPRGFYALSRMERVLLRGNSFCSFNFDSTSLHSSGLKTQSTVWANLRLIIWLCPLPSRSTGAVQFKYLWSKRMSWCCLCFLSYVLPLKSSLLADSFVFRVWGKRPQLS